MYKIVRSFLFLLNPESAHFFSFKAIKLILNLPAKNWIVRKIFNVKDSRLERIFFGLKFPNPVGLAAGFDKDATLFDELGSFGFGFVEIGTVTPLPQIGNPKPRLFRLKKDNAIINRMGFNNSGIEAVVARLKRKKSNIIIGGNIGKNKTTPNNKAINDYKYCFEHLFEYVDYFVVNVSSPNTPNLRALQAKEPLKKILNGLQTINNQKRKRKPILLKISPDLNENELIDIIAIVNETKIDGVIASNTTIDRGQLKSKNKEESGGLSGKPLSKKSTEIIRFLSEKSKKSFPIIGVGGIHSAEDAKEKINAGAELIQLYTGFIYEGPGIVKKINKSLIQNS